MLKHSNHIFSATGEPVIRIRDLKKSFDDIPVLDGLNMDVYKGENIVVLGRSGSGKSVLIKIISGLLKPDSGSVVVLGQEVDQLDIKALRQLRLKIGFSFQSNALYDSMTVFENLRFPLVRNKRELNAKEAGAAIGKVLEDVGLPEMSGRMPAELSGGQKKRISIARTLILQPEIMLYDEPTAGLDPITSVEINHLINEVQERYNTSSVIITHDLTCAKTTGDTIMMILDGKIAAKGSFDAVSVSDNEVVREFFDYNYMK